MKIIKTIWSNSIWSSCLEAIQLDNEIIYLEKNEISVASLKKDHKEFIKSNKSILKTKQRFKSKSQNALTKKITKIDWSSNGHKRMQSIELIKTYAYGTRKDLVNEKKEIKCNNIVKQYKNG